MRAQVRQPRQTLLGRVRIHSHATPRFLTSAVTCLHFACLPTLDTGRGFVQARLAPRRRCHDWHSQRTNLIERALSSACHATPVRSPAPHALQFWPDDSLLVSYTIGLTHS